MATNCYFDRSLRFILFCFLVVICSALVTSSLAPAKGFGLPLRYAKDPCRSATATLSPKATLCRYAFEGQTHTLRFVTKPVKYELVLPYSCLICFLRRHFVQVFVNMAEQTVSPNVYQKCHFYRSALFLVSSYLHPGYLLTLL